MVEDELQQRQKKRAEGSQCQDKLEGVHRITCLKRNSVGDATARPGGFAPGSWLFWRKRPATRAGEAAVFFLRNPQVVSDAGDFKPFPAVFLARLACFM